MKGLKERAASANLARHGVSIWRVIVLAMFGAIGAWLLASVAPQILDFLFRKFTAAITKTEPTGGYPANVFISSLPFAFLGAILGGFLGNRFTRWLEKLDAKWDKMDVGDKVNVFLGAFAGLVGSVPFLVLFQNLTIQPVYKGLVVTAVVLGLSALSIYMLQSMAEVLPWSRMRGKSKRSGIKLLDTNVIIDGRIYDVAKTGFLEGELYVPGFVLDELQYIADSHDGLRRQRGRRGLEVLRHMQSDFPMEVRVHDRLAPDTGDGVDSRLVRLAKAVGGDIVTNDWNLNRVATLQDVKVLNINDLSLSLRPNVLPSENLELTLVREGNQIGQGVGYLEDGTMVVVENGRPYIGETREVTVTQVIQTERGKMIFAKIEEDDGRYDAQPPRRGNPRRNHA